MIIGLTGRSGCGKSFAANFFEIKGFKIIDFDKICKSIYEPGSKCLNEVIEHFGTDILNDNGTLNRKRLAEIVFNNQEMLQKLNKITHRYIYNEAVKLKEKYKNKHIIYDAPLLFEANLDVECDYIISILSNEKTQIERIVKRDNISEELAKKRLASQKPNNFFIERSDFYIMNNSTIEDFKKELNNVYEKIFPDFL